MLPFLNPRSPNLMLSLYHGILPKVVSALFTTLNWGGGGEETKFVLSMFNNFVILAGMVSRVLSKIVACAIRVPQGENRGHETVRGRCAVKLLVYVLFCGTALRATGSGNIKSTPLLGRHIEFRRCAGKGLGTTCSTVSEIEIALTTVSYQPETLKQFNINIV